MFSFDAVPRYTLLIPEENCLVARDQNWVLRDRVAARLSHPAAPCSAL